MRQKPRAARLGIMAPPPKRMKKSANHGSEPTRCEMDADSYVRHVRQLEKEEPKTITNRSAIKSLMKETSSNRRKWIVLDRPPVSEILQVFPSLKEYDYVNCSKYIFYFWVQNTCTYSYNQLSLHIHAIT